MNKNEPDIQLIRKTIMVVDDEEALRMLYKSYFENEYDMILMNDGHEALIYISENHIPDLILLDMEMPNMNGRVFLRRIRYGSAKINKIPIIFISSVSNKLMIKSTLNHGVEDYIVKPFKKEELIEKVHVILNA